MKNIHLPTMPACRVLFLTLLCLPLPAAAAIYQYVDESGIRVLSNTPHKGAVQLHLPPLQVIRTHPVPVTVPMTGRPHGRTLPTAPSHLIAPLRISPQTQQVRETRRRKILENELALEERRLQDTQRRLASPPRDPLEAAQLRTQLATHQKNIDALHQELAGTR